MHEKTQSQTTLPKAQGRDARSAIAPITVQGSVKRAARKSILDTVRINSAKEREVVVNVQGARLYTLNLREDSRQ